MRMLSIAKAILALWLVGAAACNRERGVAPSVTPARWEYGRLSLDWSSGRSFSEADNQTFVWESPSERVASADWREFQQLMGVQVRNENRDTRRSAIHLLQKLGGEGWELVSYNLWPTSGWGDFYYFKRPVLEQPQVGSQAAR